MSEVIRLDNSLKNDANKIGELSEKIEKLKRKYVSVFRLRNPDLRHFKTE